MTEQEVENYLAEAVELRNADDFDGIDRDIGIRTFAEAGVLTYNRGLVLRTPDGDEFQITIVRSN